jgi:hypothetical protein
MRAIVHLAALTTMLAVGRPGFAQDATKKCITAHADAQLRLNEGKLRAARMELSACAAARCHPSIVSECTRMLEELDRDQPSLVLSAKSTTGGDVANATASIDGAAAERLDGRALLLDPGQHRIVIEAPGFRPSETEVVVRVGENQRQLELTLAPVVAPAPGAKSQPKRKRIPRSGGLPTATYVLGGVGFLAAGVAGLFYVDGYRKDRKLRDECAPNCSDERIDQVRSRFLVGDILAGVSLLSFGGAVFIATTTDGDRVGSLRFSGRF